MKHTHHIPEFALIAVAALVLSCGDDGGEKCECPDGSDGAGTGSGTTAPATTGDGDTTAGSGSGTGGTSAPGTTGDSNTATGEPVPFEEPKFLFEHNATDEDTGFQAFIDGVPWKLLNITDPTGEVILEINAKGNAEEWGLTELFFETREPPNSVVPIEELFALFPEGDYTFTGKSADPGGPNMEAVATLSHVIPAKPNIVAPEPEAVLDLNSVMIDWDPVTESLDGGPVTIVAYQVIVVKNIEEEYQGFGNRELSAHVMPETTAMSVPPEFLEPGTPYEIEILALEESGNQTISAITFETEP
jgi:hypothetical protein